MMMIKLMTWFIELQNKFNESRLFKISTIYILNWVDDLTSWHWDLKHEFSELFNVDIDVKNWMYLSF